MLQKQIMFYFHHIAMTTKIDRGIGSPLPAGIRLYSCSYCGGT